jgi:DNA invertase Pin-like site-specific DNA recombinase
MDKARDIRQSKVSVKELADMYGVGKSTIERVINNVTWKEDVVPPFGSVIRLD